VFLVIVEGSAEEIEDFVEDVSQRRAIGDISEKG